MGINFEWVADSRALSISLICVFLVILRTGKDIIRHIQFMEYKSTQNHIIYILAMIPIYSILSFISLILPQITVCLDIIRDSYESIVLYQFFRMLVQFMNGDDSVISYISTHTDSISHLFPIQYISRNGFITTNFFAKCKYGILQYCFIKPVMSLFSCIFYFTNLYSQADFSFNNSYVYISLINNISIAISLYFLLLFCDALKSELNIHKPLNKLLCIKIIIFFCFWQDFFIDILISKGFLNVGTGIDGSYVTLTLCDYLICIQLVPIAILHHYSFGYKIIFFENGSTKFQYQKTYKNIFSATIKLFGLYKSYVIYMITILLFTFIYSLLGTNNFNITNNLCSYIYYSLSVSIFSDTGNFYPITNIAMLFVIVQKIFTMVLVYMNLSFLTSQVMHKYITNALLIKKHNESQTESLINTQIVILQSSMEDGTQKYFL